MYSKYIFFKIAVNANGNNIVISHHSICDRISTAMKNIYSINYASFHVYGSVHPKQMMSYAFQRFPLLLSFNFLYRKYRFICCLNKITINIDTRLDPYIAE